MKTVFNGRKVYLEIEHGRRSYVDSFISSGYYEDGDMADLTEAELDEAQDFLAGEIVDNAIENGIVSK